ncbi:MAG: hypothetical protein IID41_17985 [Planctomycetes bacterium]|nr:hypothetical protein [Planctomycetota bacterium]
MEFRIEMKIEVEEQSDDLSTRVPVIIQILYRGGRWQAQCVDPPFSTLLCDSLEEALVQAAKDASKELSTA